MDRKKLGERALGWRDGYQFGVGVVQAEKDTRRDEVFQEGRRYERKRIPGVEWFKLFSLIVAAWIMGKLFWNLIVIIAAALITHFFGV